ncbi:MAG: LD-carboxypeptidase [Deferribacteres bacterium]|nr:LD-carboxypeptidase [candidate division KSB1 bacterium]MCB9502575.1 LD-carboxypeptidase [Deferribacteres bacterium]
MKTTRRQFLQQSSLALFAATLPVFPRGNQSKTNTLLKPPALNSGDTVGLVAPASVLFETNRMLMEAEEKMHELGFKTKRAKNIGKRYGYLAGSVKDRVADLHDMFRDGDVQAIVAVRGGYGSAQLLPHLNYDLIRKHPKILIGYSDITALALGIYVQTGLVTFHGPVATSTFSDYTKKYFLSTLGSTEAIGEIDDAPYSDNLQTSNRVWTVQEGVAEGRLVGGNLTLLQSLLGTPYEPDTNGAILFMEEVGEEPYDLDRMLNHLKQAGKFDGVKGIFFDKMPSVKPASLQPGFNSSLSVEQVIEDVFKNCKFPLCVGLSIGHIKDKPTLPLGIQARLDATHGRLSLLEGAVV